jgi:hypothetical protein
MTRRLATKQNIDRLESAIRSDQLEFLGWKAATARTARLLCRIHGLMPIKRITKEKILLVCGCSRSDQRLQFEYGRNR